MEAVRNLTRRARWIAAGAVVALIAGLVISLARSGDGGDAPPRSAPRDVDPGGDAASPRVRLPPSGGRWFGFNDSTFVFTGWDQPELDFGVPAERQFADAAAAGANSARLFVSWWDLEPEQGRVDQGYVARLKAYTDPLERAGGRALLVLGVPPPWAQAASHPSATIRDEEGLVEAFGRYAGEVARIWPNAAAIETWNEPNTTYFWRPRKPEPSLYTQMHKAAAAAIRSAAPGVKVVFGGLLGSPADTRAITSPQSFLKRAYAAGLTPADYDALAYHPYPLQAGKGVGSLESGAFAQAFDDFRLGYRWRDAGARVWITETGATTTGTGAFFAVGPDVQAQAVVALTRKLLSMDDVDALYLHALYERVNFPASSFERGFGLLLPGRDGPSRPKPAFCALRRLVADSLPFSGCP